MFSRNIRTVTNTNKTPTKINAAGKKEVENKEEYFRTDLNKEEGKESGGGVRKSV